MSSDRTPAEHVGVLVERLDGKHAALAGPAADCAVEPFLGFGSESGQGGDVLPAPMLGELGLLGSHFVLDLHPPVSDRAPTRE
ncbi:hypothetical protein [Streptomyces lavendulocolor]|uniref:hypothetical protein n=1 Tax=Streptomyces lavendulocolor TaxID=67316 RepID=UPI003403D355